MRKTARLLLWWLPALAITVAAGVMPDTFLDSPYSTIPHEAAFTLRLWLVILGFAYMAVVLAVRLGNHLASAHGGRSVAWPTRWPALILPFVIQPVFHIMYQPVNEAWTVNRFGCGCPPISGESRFNANDFNLIVWALLFLVCVVTWWLGLRRTFTKSSRLTTVGFVGVMLLMILCASRYFKECWL